MRILVLFNAEEGLGDRGDEDREAVQSVQGTAAAVETALTQLGHQAWTFPVAGPPDRVIGEFLRQRPDLAFNLVESVQGRARLEAAVAWVLEWIGVPFTGSPPEALSLALDKAHAKAVLEAASVPVPKGVVLARGDERFEHLRAPWIVKPLRQDASHGIDGDSVTHVATAARAKAAQLQERFSAPALIEELIEGRELNVSILGSGHDLEALPPGEIDYSGLPEGRPRILTYDAKWREDSPEYRGTPAIAALPLTAEEEARVNEVARSAYRALGLRGYGRVDLRLDPARGPVVLEVNPNPDLSPDAGLARAAQRKGLRYEELIARIIGAARPG